jgi:non-canonical (house-cleaning) NTP pyrophosphatase
MNTLHCFVHMCSELVHSDPPTTFTVGLEANVNDVKALYLSHKVAAIVGHGKGTSTSICCPNF